MSAEIERFRRTPYGRLIRVASWVLELRYGWVPGFSHFCSREPLTNACVFTWRRHGPYGSAHEIHFHASTMLGAALRAIVGIR